MSTLIEAWLEYDLFMSEVHDIQLEPELDSEFDKLYRNFNDKLKELEELYEEWKKLQLFLEKVNLDNLDLVVTVNRKFVKLFEEEQNASF